MYCVSSYPLSVGTDQLLIDIAPTSGIFINKGSHLK